MHVAKISSTTPFGLQFLKLQHLPNCLVVKRMYKWLELLTESLLVSNTFYIRHLVYSAHVFV